MVYYKVKKEYGDTVVKNRVLISEELYTEVEMQRFNVPKRCTERVEISKNDTYTFFNARFQSNHMSNQ